MTIENDEPIEIYIDAGSRGNPGPSAFGVVAYLPGGTIKVESGKIGRLTNQMAEFTALQKALEMANLYAWHSIDVFTDSRLLSQASNGLWKLKSQPLVKLMDAMIPLASKIKSVPGGHVSITWVPRETPGIIEADKLVNKALNISLI